MTDARPTPQPNEPRLAARPQEAPPAPPPPQELPPPITEAVSLASAPPFPATLPEDIEPSARRRGSEDETEVEAAPPRAYELDRSEKTSIKLYLQEIGPIPLLTPEQEVVLAARIKKGDTEARDLMIRSNLRLVVKIAHDYKDFGLPLVDLISEGNIGLIKAVERFDPAKGGKLSTYAAWWIKQAIKRALANQSKTIRLPVHLVEKVSRMRKITNQLTDELEREPTDDEIAEVMGIPVHKVAHLKSVSTRPASLDAPIGDAEDSTRFGEVVGDENALSPFESLKEKAGKADLHRIISELDPREAEIIRLRFGFDGGEELTLEDVGQRFNITRERVRQLQNIAISKIRKALASREAQRTKDEIDAEERQRQRQRVLDEYAERKRGRA